MKQLQWHCKNQQCADMLGFIPGFIHEDDPRPAKEQLHTAYGHGGGWNKFEGFEFDANHYTLKYPGDPKFGAVGWAVLRDEKIIVFQHAWVLILQKDGSYEIARMD